MSLENVRVCRNGEAMPLSTAGSELITAGGVRSCTVIAIGLELSLAVPSVVAPLVAVTETVKLRLTSFTGAVKTACELPGDGCEMLRPEDGVQGKLNVAPALG